MIKSYVANTFLQVADLKLNAIFAWSQREPDQILKKSWLVILEIFVHDHYLEDAYQKFQKIRENYSKKTVDKSLMDLDYYQSLLGDGIIQLGESKITLFARGFRSFIEKDKVFELGENIQQENLVLLKLFNHLSLDDDLETINTRESFNVVVSQLENLGLLSPTIASINWGDLRKPFPICQAFGLTRGTPVDRYYLSQFMAEIHTQITGEILEIGGTPKDKDFYQLNPGTSYRILNIEAGLGVDIVGDVHDENTIKLESLDSIIIFNVLEHCYAPWTAVENIYKWLKPGGKCFAMVPSAIRVHATPRDYWRPLPDGFSYIFRNFSDQKLYVYGNPITAIASYQGIATEELTTKELNAFHPDYPVATCIVAQK